MFILQMNQFLNYLKYSGFWIGFVINPFHWQWGVRSDTISPNRCKTLYIGPFWFTIAIDNGKNW